MRGCEGTVTVRISGGKRNQRRRSLYWVVCALVTQVLNDANDLTLTDDDLHDLTRKKLRLYDEITLPSGEVHIKLRSTSDKAMSEADRAVYTDRAFAVWSSWIGVPVDVLTREAANNS